MRRMQKRQRLEHECTEHVRAPERTPYSMSTVSLPTACATMTLGESILNARQREQHGGGTIDLPPGLVRDDDPVL